MQEYSSLLGQVVKKARLDMKLTQLEVADRIHADERTILNIEHNKGNPKLEILWPLLRTLNIDANDVFYPERANDSEEALHLQLLFSQCSEDELRLLTSICESVINTYRSSQGKEIKKRK